ncbi:MAG: energy-dependent translational throttle protein EttA [Planctomycetes bacterium]|nr:energy-dependent translational throttle protein EttA [Planctomycetota bacterium]
MPQLLGETLVTVKDLTKSFGDREILRPMSFTIHRDARIGILGLNGVGKSTFMRILAGEEKEYGGTVRWTPGIRVGYVSQEPPLDEAKTVRENIEVGLAHIHEVIEEFNQVSEKLGTGSAPEAYEKLMERMGRLQETIEAVGGWEVDRHVEVAMEALRVPPGDARVTKLSGGERRRVALCRELISHPDLLILDEPTNHLDASTIEWLEMFIDGYQGTVVMVTHDRYFLDNVANYMVEIENGQLYVYEGNYSDYLQKKEEILELRQKAEDRRQRFLKRELEWMSSTPAARRSKAKARIKNYEKLHEQGPELLPDTVNLVIPPGPRLGNKVLEAKDVTKGYGGRVLIEGLSFSLVPGEIMGVVGPNGVGKTTLLRMILGHEKPDSGSIEVGPTVKLTYVDQTREELNPGKTVYEEISEGRDVIQVGAKEYHIREYLSGFQFKGGQQQTLVGKLSGGERNRLLLAKTLRRGANLILLDEPTNDLDVTTLRVLEDALESFAGSAIVVSHDRFFLDRVVNSLLVFEEDGRVHRVEGNFETYFEQRKEELERLGVQSTKLRKTSYRKMVRK